ncbi:MAG: GPW/gp25 family protein [Flavobacteriaceae bacterium]|nr:GPW/gp25 family protein [Flavobacteriaceae bacterium]
METNTIFQTGWPFLPEIVKNGSRLTEITYYEDIVESLTILFTTLPGERIGHPLYGCDLMQFMFNPINNSLITNMNNTITTAITMYESRIEIIDLVIEINAEVWHQIDIDLFYEISQTSSRYNMTIPFYIMEGFAEI